MTLPSLSLKPGDLVPLPAHGTSSATRHVVDEDSIYAIEFALATGRPLLVRGEPGTGKSQLARAAASAMGRAFLSHAVDGRTETRDLLWTLDAVARLAEAQVVGARRELDDQVVEQRIQIRRFVHPGPLWWAYHWESAQEQAELAKLSPPATPDGWEPPHGVVVLLDEIDKADASVPNGLLDALGHGQFDVPGGAPVEMNRTRSPLVIITTNEERSLPDAFLRRCLVLHLTVPEDRDALIAFLDARAVAHFDAACDATVRRRAAELLADDRAKLRGQNLALPGVAEYIDLLHGVTTRERDPARQRALLDKIAKFALCKHPPLPGH